MVTVTRHARQRVRERVGIPAMGKKPAAGWGIVEKWEAEEIAEDYSLWHPEHGLMRPVLVGEESEELSKELANYPIMEYGVKPPYWKLCNFRRCYVPYERD